MSRRQWRRSGIEQGRHCCHDAELHAHLHGSSGVHIAQGPDTVHFALQPGAHTRRAAFEVAVADVRSFAKSWPLARRQAYLTSRNQRWHKDGEHPMWISESCGCGMPSFCNSATYNRLDPRAGLGTGITHYVPSAAMCRQAYQARTQTCCLVDCWPNALRFKIILSNVFAKHEGKCDQSVHIPIGSI